MEYLPIRGSPTVFPVEVEGRGEVDWLGGLPNDENLLKNVFSPLFVRLELPSELPGGRGEFD